MYDVTIGNDLASLGSERTDIMNTKGKKPKRKVKMDYGDGSIYFVKSRNCYAGQVYLEIDGKKIRKSVYGKTERIVKDKIRELQIQAKAGMRKVLINNDLAAFLKECIGERTGGTLFVSSNNKPVTTQQVNYYFWNTLKQYDIQDKSLQGKLTFHSLRHTFATRCIESGVPPKVLQKILGHKDISVTMNVYCDVFEKFEAAHLNAVDKYMKLNNIGLGKSETKTVKVA